jgi:thymidylate synthase
LCCYYCWKKQLQMGFALHMLEIHFLMLFYKSYDIYIENSLNIFTYQDLKSMIASVANYYFYYYLHYKYIYIDKM